MRDKINDDLKTAMKAGDKDRVGTLRLVNSAIKSADIDARPSGKDKISDADILSVLAKMVKQRRDSIEQFNAGGRPELAAKEAAEITVIDVGDRGQAWGSPGYGQGYAVLGERAWIADVSVAEGGEDKRDAVVQILGMMFD